MEIQKLKNKYLKSIVTVDGEDWYIDKMPEENNMHYCINCGARVVQYVGSE